MDPTTSSPAMSRPSARRTPLVGHLGDRDARLDRDAVGDELGGDQDGQLGVERGEDLVGRLDDRHGDPLAGEVLGGLEADEPGPDDHGRLAARPVTSSAEPLGVLDGP